MHFIENKFYRELTALNDIVHGIKIVRTDVLVAILSDHGLPFLYRYVCIYIYICRRLRGLSRLIALVGFVSRLSSLVVFVSSVSSVSSVSRLSS